MPSIQPVLEKCISHNFRIFSDQKEQFLFLFGSCVCVCPKRWNICIGFTTPFPIKSYHYNSFFHRTSEPMKYNLERLKHSLSMELDSPEHSIALQMFDQDAVRSKYFSMQ